MSQPPEYTPERTATQRLADDIATALANLRRDWPHMIPANYYGAGPGWATRSGVHVTNPDVTDDEGHLIDGHKPHELDRSYEDLALRGQGAPDSDMRRIDRVISFRVHATRICNEWCRLVIDDRGTTGHIPDGLDVPAMAQFLERHADWLSGHEAAEDARSELRDLAHRTHLIAYPAKRESMSIGRCPLEVPGEQDVLETCGGDVRSRLTDGDADGQAWAACNRCGEVAVAAWWEDRMFDDPETRRWLTDADIVTFMHRTYGETIAQSTVRQWVKRQVLVPSGETTDDGRRLFARDAVVYAIDLHKRRQEVRA